MYVESTGPKAGDKAILRSLEFFKMQGDPCQLQFYYHAFGSDLGALIVQVSDLMYNVSLESLDVWKEEEMNLKDVGGKYTVSWHNTFLIGCQGFRE